MSGVLFRERVVQAEEEEEAAQAQPDAGVCCIAAAAVVAYRLPLVSAVESRETPRKHQCEEAR